MTIKSIEVFAFKYDHHYRLGGHTDAPNRMPGTDYYFEPQWCQAYSRLTESCLVKVETSTGLTGWGEAQSPLVPEVPATLIARLFAPAILGMDVMDTDAIYHKLYHLNHVRGHTASYTIDAITAIDIALWDIKGKVLNEPLSRLLSPSPLDKLPLYVSGLRRPTLPERKAFVEDRIADGYFGFKIFIGDTPQKTLEEISAINDTTAGRAEVAFDAICAHSYESALEIGKGLDDMDVAWFEAPMDPEDVDGHHQLAKSITTPLAIGEPLRTVREFQPWIQKKAMKVGQPDIVRCGITGGLKIAGKLEEAGIAIAPHIGVCTAIGMAATWQFSASMPDVEMQEHQYDLFSPMNKVLISPLEVLNGKGIIPQSTGLGIAVDEDFVRQQSSETWYIGQFGLRHYSKPIHTHEN